MLYASHLLMYCFLFATQTYFEHTLKTHDALHVPAVLRCTVGTFEHEQGALTPYLRSLFIPYDVSPAAILTCSVCVRMCVRMCVCVCVCVCARVLLPVRVRVVQCCCSGILVGAGQQKKVAVFNLVSYYCIGLPVGAALMLATPLRLLGERQANANNSLFYINLICSGAHGFTPVCIHV